MYKYPCIQVSRATLIMEDWAANHVEQRLVMELIPYARNARTHNENQVKQIADSIEEWGWTVPIVIDDKEEIIAGHGRIRAAEMLGIKKVPVVVVKGWSDEKKRAYRLADNRIALNSDWDYNMLELEVTELTNLGVDIKLSGYTEQEIDAMLNSNDVDIASEWVGMPEYKQENKEGFKSLIVHFKTEDDYISFSNLISQPLTSNTRYVWYPEIDILQQSNKRYITDES